MAKEIGCGTKLAEEVNWDQNCNGKIKLNEMSIKIGWKVFVVWKFES